MKLTLIGPSLMRYLYNVFEWQYKYIVTFVLGAGARRYTDDQ